MDNSTMYVVGQAFPDEGPKAWELVGIFNDESAADAACLSVQHFVGPMQMNNAIHGPPIEWVGAYYPRANELLGVK